MPGTRAPNASSQRAARHAQRDLARLPAAAHLRAEDPAGAGRAVGVVGQLVRRRLRHRAQFLPAVRDRRARPTSTCTPSSCCPPEERKAFLLDRKGAIVGRKLADQYGWKIGDLIPLRGTIFPGTWTFTLRGIYDGADARAPTSRQIFFHWELLNETIKKRYPRRGDQTGVFIVAAARSRRRRPRSRRRSTRRSRTRSPRR